MAGTGPAMTKSGFVRRRAGARSMPAMALFHRRELLRTGLALKARLPGLVGHAVDGLAALVLAHRCALGVGFLFQPVRQAVAAEARQIHQIDVLDVVAGAQMLDEAPEHRGLEFRSGFVVNRHGRTLVVSRKDTGIRWALSQILPYRGANRVSGMEFGRPLGLKTLPPRLTAPAA